MRTLRCGQIKKIQLWLNIKNDMMTEYKEYCLGTFVIIDNSFTYDESTNILSCNCSDLMITLDGTINGEMGAWDYKISYGWVISTVFKTVLSQFAGITNYSVEEMGMYYGINYYIQQFISDYSPDVILLDILYQAAREAREFPSKTLISEPKIRSNKITAVLEQMHSEYSNNSENSNPTSTVIPITFDSVKTYYEIDTESIPNVGGRLSYYLFNCTGLENYIGQDGLYVYDKYGNTHRVKVVKILNYVCLDIGYTSPIRGDDNTLIQLSQNELNSKSIKIYSRAGFVQESTFNKLVDAFKYLIEIPYLIEIDTTTTIYELLNKLLELYPGWEMFFDVYGRFICQMIPTAKDDLPVLDYDVFDNLLNGSGGESQSISYEGIRNVVQVFGEEYTVDNFSENCIYDASKTYTATLEHFISYEDGFYICILIPKSNPIGCKLKINDLESHYIYDTITDKYINPNTLKKGYYVFRYSNLGKWYLLGQYRPMAVTKLVDIEPSMNDKIVDIEKYNCSNIKYIVNPENPFTVQKIGERYRPIANDDAAGITSDSLALSNAEFYIYKLARLPDSIVKNIIPIPFLDVNQKVRSRIQTGDINSYITKSISLNIIETDFSMVVNMNRFYELYPDIITN